MQNKIYKSFVAEKLSTLVINTGYELISDNNQLAAIFFKIVVKDTLRSRNIASRTSV